MTTTKIAPLDTAQDVSTLGVEQLQSLLQKATASDPCQGNRQMVEFTLKLKKRLSDLTELNRAQTEALNQQIAELGKSKAEAEASLADARAVRQLIERMQVQAAAELEAIGELGAVSAEVYADFNRKLEAVLAPARQERQMAMGAALQPQPSPQQRVYTPEIVRQTVHRPKTDQKPMIKALTSIGVYLVLLLGCGGIVLASWLSNRQMLSAPSAGSVLTEPAAPAAPAAQPTPQFYDADLVAAANHVKTFDPATRSSWQQFCSLNNQGAGYAKPNQDICRAISLN